MTDDVTLIDANAMVADVVNIIASVCNVFYYYLVEKCTEGCGNIFEKKQNSLYKECVFKWYYRKLIMDIIHGMSVIRNITISIANIYMPV